MDLMETVPGMDPMAAEAEEVKETVVVLAKVVEVVEDV